MNTNMISIQLRKMRQRVGHAGMEIMFSMMDPWDALTAKMLEIQLPWDNLVLINALKYRDADDNFQTASHRAAHLLIPKIIEHLRKLHDVDPTQDLGQELRRTKPSQQAKTTRNPMDALACVYHDLIRLHVPLTEIVKVIAIYIASDIHPNYARHHKSATLELPKTICRIREAIDDYNDKA